MGVQYQPFFIVGCGRSGTTLLRSLLTNHSQVAIPLESLFLVDYLRVSNEFPFERLMNLFIREPEIQEWGIEITASDFDGCETVEDLIIRVHELYAITKGKSRWGQKTPRFVRYIDLLIDHFPDSRFIHMIRDPRAVVNSLIRSNVHRSTAFHASKRWCMDVEIGLDFERRYPERILQLRYENLVTNPENELSKLTEFLEIQYEETMLSGMRRSAGEYSPFYQKIHANVDRSPTDEFIGRWQTELNPEDIQIVEAVDGVLMTELGYEYEYPDQAPAEINLTKFYPKRILGLIRQTWRYLRYRPSYLFYVLWRKQRLGLLRDFFLDIHY
jgi:hypothetical protein